MPVASAGLLMRFKSSDRRELINFFEKYFQKPVLNRNTMFQLDLIISKIARNHQLGKLHSPTQRKFATEETRVKRPA